ncbi:hypothetical protein G6F16_009345 [Rhizopus arrhizus]|nr:hypothetical protein G6F16_009345 [Rhizopus arrhizus]
MVTFACLFSIDLYLAVTGLSEGYGFITFRSESSARHAYHEAHRMTIDDHKILIDYERGRTMKGWRPRRLGGGYGGKKESGQLRFGARDRPFRQSTHRPSDDKRSDHWKPILKKSSHRSPLPYEGLSSLFTPPASDVSEEYQSASEEGAVVERKNSIRLGQEINHLIETDHAKNAIELLKEAISQLESGEEEAEEISIVYSKIIKSLCDPQISNLINDNECDIYHSVLWRLMTRVIESGYTLQREAHVTLVNTLIDKGHVPLALQVMYTLPRPEWDTECYRIALLLHLMQRPRQIQEAESLLFDYGKPSLEVMVNDVPTRIEMPWMSQVTEEDREQFWMLYQATISADKEWDRRKSLYEAQQRDYAHQLKTRHAGQIVQDWAREHVLHVASEREQVDQASIQNDNSMIYSAARHQQFEYAWQVYLTMRESVDEVTPALVMHLCWTAFSQIAPNKVSQRRAWEERAWSVYSRFMCSEYLHPEAPETPGFLQDILLIATHSVERDARLTKAMAVYHSLTRFEFSSLLSDERVLEPILCSIVYECTRAPITKMSGLAFDIWQKKWRLDPATSLSALWGLLILCVKSGNKAHFKQVVQKMDSELVSPSVMAPIQTFHDMYLCRDCYFEDYMFQTIKYTDRTLISFMDPYGFNDQQQTDLNEPQAIHITTAVLDGLLTKESERVQRKMYYSTKKANVILRHCLLTAQMSQ